MLLKKLVNLTLSESRALTDFLEEWQGTLEEAAIAGLTFTEKQQIVLLLSALPQSWRAFITTQGNTQNQTLVDLISNMLQEEAMTASDQSPEKSTAFFTRNKSPRKRLYNPRHLQEQSIPTSSMAKSKNAICHYCGKSGHKRPECRKKARNETAGIFKTQDLTQPK